MGKSVLLVCVAVAVCVALSSAAAPQYDVIVVGGGLSGLNAAYRLVKTHKVDPKKVLLLEARPRFGGRTYSPIVKKYNGDDTRRDYGAEFTSPTAKRLMGYQDDFGLHRTLVFTDGPAIFEDSELHPYSAMRQIPMPMPFTSKLDYLQGIARFTVMMRKINLQKIQESKDAVELDNQNLEDFCNNVFHTKPAREFFRIMMEVMYGSPAKDISMLQLAHFVKSCHGLIGLKNSGKWHLRGGSQQVSEGLVKNGGFRMILNSPVVKIEHDNKGVRVHTRHAFKKDLDVKGQAKPAPELPDCKSNKEPAPPMACPATSRADPKEADVNLNTFTARFVIMAVPLPFAHNITYDPPMPPGRQELTKASYMATYTKVQLVCEKRTWKFYGGFATNGPFPIFADSSHPPEDDMDEAMIVGFFVPPSSLEVKKHNETVRRDMVFSQMKRQLKDPNVNPDKCKYHEMEWDDDPWGKGVTVVLNPGTLSKYGRFLKQPIGRIFIGGSETSYEWNGYMEGALESGERTAAEVSAAMECEDEMNGLKKATAVNDRDTEGCAAWKRHSSDMGAQGNKIEKAAQEALEDLVDKIEQETAEVKNSSPLDKIGTAAKKLKDKVLSPFKSSKL